MPVSNSPVTTTRADENKRLHCGRQPSPVQPQQLLLLLGILLARMLPVPLCRDGCKGGGGGGGRSTGRRLCGDSAHEGGEDVARGGARGGCRTARQRRQHVRREEAIAAQGAQESARGAQGACGRRVRRVGRLLNGPVCLTRKRFRT